MPTYAVDNQVPYAITADGKEIIAFSHYYSPRRSSTT